LLLLLLLLLLLMACAPSRHRVRLASATDLPGKVDSVERKWLGGSENFQSCVTVVLLLLLPVLSVILLIQ